MKCPCICHNDMSAGGKHGIWDKRINGLWRFRCAHCWSVGEWDLSVPIEGVEFTIL